MSLLIPPRFFGAHFPLALRTPCSSKHFFGLFCLSLPLHVIAKHGRTQDSRVASSQTSLFSRWPCWVPWLINTPYLTIILYPHTQLSFFLEFQIHIDILNLTWPKQNSIFSSPTQPHSSFKLLKPKTEELSFTLISHI